MTKKYLFILCPPFCGSTLLYKILHTSPNISTLAGNGNWAGEGTWLYSKENNKYINNRWNPNYNIPIKDL